jgi:glycosyltransferase involved in cell wall biosynthesis
VRQRFLHLSATDGGGAGQAAVRLHEGLLNAGQDSTMVVLDKVGQARNVTSLGSGSFRARRVMVKALLKPLCDPDYYFQDQRLAFSPQRQLVDMARAFKPDVVVAHFLSHFVSFEDVLAIQSATGAPVIWHLLDMATMTGGCHYSWSCAGYQKTCGECPALRVRGRRDASARTMEQKIECAGQMRGVVVAGSSSLARQARSSTLFRQSSIETVLMGVSPETFTPLRRPAARARLDLQTERRIIFFGAQKFSQRRKGMPLLSEALGRLAGRLPAADLPFLLIAGDASDFADLSKHGYPQRQLGFVGTEMLADAYAAADFFVCPSVEDSGPMMINEALMSGTPVVAFDIGVVPDLVQSGLTGAVAAQLEPVSLAEAMSEVLGWSPDQHATAVARCRQRALELSTAENQAKSFIRIARSLNGLTE